jgi:hypothetical protein
MPRHSLRFCCMTCSPARGPHVGDTRAKPKQEPVPGRCRTQDCGQRVNGVRNRMSSAKPTWSTHLSIRRRPTSYAKTLPTVLLRDIPSRTATTSQAKQSDLPRSRHSWPLGVTGVAHGWALYSRRGKPVRAYDVCSSAQGATLVACNTRISRVCRTEEVILCGPGATRSTAWT